MSAEQFAKATTASQAAYALFDSLGPFAALVDIEHGGMTPGQAEEFLGLVGNNVSADFGVSVRHHSPDDIVGFSATVLKDNTGRQTTLAIRGTAGAIDFLQDAQLTVQGYASAQFISLFRYYRQLTTPVGQAVQYSTADRDLLHGINVPVSIPGFGLGPNAVLDALLAQDAGLGVLDPAEQLVVTGHSLGGHLALLFGRAFPGVAQSVYTFNAPGIRPQGEFFLDLAGLPPAIPARVTNIVADFGTDITAALGTRPGRTVRVFNEVGGLSDIAHNHSIVQLSDSLAMYDLLARLSPQLGENLEEIKSILAAASARPERSLESALDMLSLALAGEPLSTPIARTGADQAQRDEYYRALYSLRDRFADGSEWGLHSLAGMSADALAEAAAFDGSYRFALKELMPFAVSEGTFDPALEALSLHWISVRADFVAGLVDARTADRLYGLSGEPSNELYVDLGKNERLAVLGPRAAVVAQVQGTAERVNAYLDTVAYSRVTTFGTDDADALQGIGGEDVMFGEAGDDMLEGAGGDDVLEGGAGDDTLDGGAGDDTLFADAGADVLSGGAGFDIYSLAMLPDEGDPTSPSDVFDPSSAPVITDSDGVGGIFAGTRLTGGSREGPDDPFVSDDGLHFFEFSGGAGQRGTLTIDGVVEVRDFRNGDLGILLRDATAPIDEFAPTNIFNVRMGAEDLPGDGEDFAYAGAGSSSINGGFANDVLMGGPGDDVLVAGQEDIDLPQPQLDYFLFDREFLSGGDGNDSLTGSARADLLEGGAGSDAIVAGAGDDYVRGDGFALSLVYNEYHYIGDVPEFVDLVSYSEEALQNNANRGKLTFALANSAGRDGVIEDAPAAGDDSVDAGSGDDIVFAGAGDDTVYGGRGDDELHGGAGNDELHGGEGFDRLSGDEGDDELHAGSESSVLDGGDGNDTLVGGPSLDFLDGGDGADVFYAAGSDFVGLTEGDTIVWGGGDTILNVGSAESGPFSAVVEVGAGFEPADFSVMTQDDPGSFLFLGAGESSGLTFQAGADWSALQVRFADGTTWGRAEILAHRVDFFEPVGLAPAYATGGSDTLFGTPGSDALSGGDGDDTYFVRAGGHDAIDDAAGDNAVHLGDVRSADTSVFASEEDLLLRYPGGELRLVSQRLGQGVESVVFDREGTAWDRAELVSRAASLPAGNVELAVQSATPGEPFDFALPANLFAGAYTVAESRIDVSPFEAETPQWLRYDPDARRFSGTPSESDVGASTVLVALRDAGAIVALAPLVVTVAGADAPAEPAPEPPAEPPSSDTGTSSPPETGSENGAEASSPGAEPQSADPPVVQSVANAASSPSPAAEEAVVVVPVTESRPVTFSPGPPVGAIEDPVYGRIDSLLSGPAGTHASGFMERYAEAMQEFRDRQDAPPPATPPEPVPTDDEMTFYNSALHAWLDRDAQRQHALAADEAWDFGGPQAAYFHAGDQVQRLSGTGADAFARPSLGNAPSLQRQVGLQEGITKLTG